MALTQLKLNQLIQDGAASNNVIKWTGSNWAASSIVLTTDVTGILPIANGGTNASTGYGAKDNLSLKSTDIASATTTDLSTTTGDFVFVTGTTAITSFGTMAAGVERTIKFTGILTLTYNSTSLILPGAVNISTGVGDTAIFRSLGSGNWICTDYTRSANPPGTIPISNLTSAVSTNTIDNLLYGQTWNWSTLTNQNALTMNMNALTIGTGLIINSTSVTTGSLISSTSSNASYTGSQGLFRFLNNSTAVTGTVLLVQANNLNSNNGLFVMASGSTGIGNSNPDAKAILDVASTTLGVLLPRMTTTQKNNISPATEGLIVYDATLHNYYFYNNSAWTAMSGGGGGSTRLDQITAANTSNSIDNLNNPQTWVWTTGTSGTNFTFANSGTTTGIGVLVSANALTTGNGLQVNSINNSLNSTNGIFFVQNGGTSVNGILAGFNNSNVSSTNGLWINAIGQVGIGTKTQAALLQISGGGTFSNNTTLGIGLSISAATYTDSSTGGSGSVVHTSAYSFGVPTFAASNSSITYQSGSTVYISGAPIGGTNVTISTAYSLYSASGLVGFVGTTATTNASQSRLILSTNLTSGTVAAAFGGSIVFRGSADASGTPNNDRDMAQINGVWRTAADATRSGRITFSIVNVTAMATYFQFDGNSGGTFTWGSSSHTLNNSAMGIAAAFTVGNSNQALTLGGSSGTVSITSTANSNGAITINTNGGASANLSILNNGANTGNTNLIRCGLGTTYSTQTSGAITNIRIDGTFAPTSGTNEFQGYLFTPTINQTGGANGATIGFKLAGVLTACADYQAVACATPLTTTSGSNNYRVINITSALSITSTASGTFIGVDINPSLTLSGSGAPTFIGVNMPYANTSAFGVYQTGTGTTNILVGLTGHGSSTAPTALLTVGGTNSLTNQGITGLMLAVKASTITDSSTATSGSVNHTASSAYGIPTFAANNASVTYQSGSTVYIDGAPTAGTNVTISNPFALYVKAGNNVFGGKTSFGTGVTPTETVNITGNMLVAGQYASTRYTLVSGVTVGLDWNNGNVQEITLGANTTLTFANPKAGARYLLIVIQNATGSNTVTWPTIKWQGGSAPTLTTTGSRTDIISLIFDGVSYFGMGSTNFF